VYFGTDKDNLYRCIELVFKEFELLRKNKLGQLQLSKAKKQLLGQIAISSENNENYMLVMGKSLLVFNRVDTLEELSRKIDSISGNLIMEIANEVLDKEKISTLLYT